jgi:hypothetical protein
MATLLSPDEISPNAPIFTALPFGASHLLL